MPNPTGAPELHPPNQAIAPFWRAVTDKVDALAALGTPSFTTPKEAGSMRQAIAAAQFPYLESPAAKAEVCDAAFRSYALLYASNREGHNFGSRIRDILREAFDPSQTRGFDQVYEELRPVASALCTKYWEVARDFPQAPAGPLDRFEDQLTALMQGTLVAAEVFRGITRHPSMNVRMIDRTRRGDGERALDHEAVEKPSRYFEGLSSPVYNLRELINHGFLPVTKTFLENLEVVERVSDLMGQLGRQAKQYLVAYNEHVYLAGRVREQQVPMERALATQNAQMLERLENVMQAGVRLLDRLAIDPFNRTAGSELGALEQQVLRFGEQVSLAQQAHLNFAAWMTRRASPPVAA